MARGTALVGVDDIREMAQQIVEGTIDPEAARWQLFVGSPKDDHVCVTVTFSGWVLGVDAEQVASLHMYLAKLCWDAGYMPSVCIVI